MLKMPPMKPRHLVSYLEKRRIPRKVFADRLGVTEQAISWWVQRGWIDFKRQCHIEVELAGDLKASWGDVPQEKRLVERAA